MRTRKRDTCNGAAVPDQTFLTGPVKVGAVVDGSLIRWGASKDGWFPCIEVRVKVDDGDGSVGGVDGPVVGSGTLSAINSRGDYNAYLRRGRTIV